MRYRWDSAVVSPDQVLKKLKPGMIIFVGSGVAEPRTAIRYLIESGPRYLEDIELIQLLSFGEAISPQARLAPHIRLKTFFSGWLAQSAITEGEVDFIPSRFMHIPQMIKSGLVYIDAAIIQITPPNKAGFCSLGLAVDAAREAMERASLTIGEINPHIPFTLGDTFVHISEFDHLIQSEEPPMYFKRWETYSDLETIANNAASLIEDESCIAFSVGPLFEALAKSLTSKHHLGIHTPFLTDALMDLMESGAITNRRKETHPGKSLASYALGTEKLLQWLDHNPLVEFQSIEKVYDPSFIGRNRRFATVIALGKVDLYGRISLPVADDYPAFGSSEIMDFFNGAELSDGGRAIFALPSREKHGRANIRLSIAELPNQFSPYESVTTVVTEFGVAYLEGKTVRQRAQALIDIAHPDDRRTLVEQAKAARILYADQIFVAESAARYPATLAFEKCFKGFLNVRFRAIKPSDEEGMRRLFYRFSDASVYSRYFHSVRAMPHAKMQEYVNVDWDQVMSIVGLIGEEGEGHIIAEGRYIRIPEAEAAEVVFVVDETYQNLGIASVIYQMLIKLAREHGIKRFLADVLFSNAAMMKVFRKGGLPVTAYLEEGVYHLDIPLA